MSPFAAVALLLSAGLAAVAAAPQPRAAAPVAVCYYGSWATYRPWPGSYQVSDIDTSLCTHLVYAFAGLNAQTLEVVSLDPYNDLEDNWGKGSYKKFAALAQTNPHITTLLAVGGWNEGSRKYSDMAATSAGRKRFVQQAAEFVAKFGFGGLDLDWQYPTQRDGRPEDKENFVLLLKELRAALGAKGLALTVAVGADPQMIGVAYDVAGIAEHVDLINLMTYDFYTAATSPVTAPSAPLTPSFGQYSVERSVDAWLGAGAPPALLVAGAPLYARTYALASAAQSGVGAPAAGAGAAGSVTREPGFLTLYELCLRQQDEPGWVEAEEGGVAYTYRGTQWATYDPPGHLRQKGEYVVQRGLAGAMAWALESDDAAGVCGWGRAPLLRALNEGLGRL